MTPIESTSIKLSTVAAMLSVIGLAFVGWYAKAVDNDIGHVKKIAEKNAAAVTENASQIRLLIQTTAQNQQLVMSAATDTRMNREALIRIETRLKKDDGESD